VTRHVRLGKRARTSPNFNCSKEGVGGLVGSIARSHLTYAMLGSETNSRCQSSHVFSTCALGYLQTVRLPLPFVVRTGLTQLRVLIPLSFGDALWWIFFVHRLPRVQPDIAVPGSLALPITSESDQVMSVTLVEGDSTFCSPREIRWGRENSALMFPLPSNR
jgi:hypothetical protein